MHVLSAGQIFKAGVFFKEGQFGHAGRAVPLFSNDHFR
jgi:hypothetical protein